MGLGYFLDINLFILVWVLLIYMDFIYLFIFGIFMGFYFPKVFYRNLGCVPRFVV